jgi:L-lactate dehydrogenase complex protein LldG
MSGDRMDFIQHVSKCLGRSELPSTPSALKLPNDIQHGYLRGASTAKLREIFVWQARAAGTTVYECALSGLNETLLTAMAALEEGAVLLADEPLWQEQQTVEALQKVYDIVRTWDHDKSREENIDYAEACAVGIAVARLALAETGTVMVDSHKGRGRSVTLLPRTTVFVIPQENIRPRLTQAMEDLDERKDSGLPSSVNFISGASSTADIELVRVQGVHGPVKIAYIVVG